jgi:glutaconyl-CoA decarboxylase
MPGTILSVSVSEGKPVKAGEIIMVLEAMKMENEIAAPCSGTVTQVFVQKGSTVDTNTVLAVIG